MMLAAPHAVHTGFHFAPVAAGTPFAGLAGPAHHAMAHHGMAAAVNRTRTSKRKGSRSRSRSRNRTGKKGKKSPSPEL